MNTTKLLVCGMIAPLALFADVKVEFYAPEAVRITKTKGDADVVHPFKTVVAKPANVAVKVSEEGGVKTYESDKLVVRENAKDGTLTFLDKNGNVLLAEAAPAKWHDREWNGTKNIGSEQAWKLSDGEAIYGLGDNQTHELDIGKWSGTLMPRNVGDGVSVWTSVKGYSVYWDNTSPVKCRANGKAITLESDIGAAVDYYFLYGGSIDGAIALIRQLSGDVPMLPRWAYGFWQSKERYKTQEETVGVVKKYRELGIPLDGIVQDWQYWGGNCLWYAMEFLSPDFSNPKWMIDEVHDMNAKMLITIWQSFGPATKQYRELSEKNLLFPFETWPQSTISHTWPPRKDYPSGVKLYDAYSADARDIYFKHLRRLIDLGIDGWWMDSTDPDHMYKEGDFEYPTSLGVTFREVRSAYPVACTQAVYEHLRKTSQNRVFILTRGAGLGEQRYAASVWSGDTGSSWDVLRRQIPGGLNYTMTGNPNFNCDLGGFFSGRYRKGGGTDNENWRELLARWMQLGTFLPMMRNHGADLPHEFYCYGKAGEPIYDALVNAVKLRYALMPYIYTVGADVTQKRASFMRPLAASFPEDKACWNIAEEFMLGDSILVAPVLKAQYTNEDNTPVGEMEGWDVGKKEEKNQGSRDKGLVDYTAKRTHSVYLPKGADWWLYGESGVDAKAAQTIFAGGKTVEIPVTLASQPFFVKAGSILPIGPAVQYNGEKAWDDLEIRIYPGANGKFELYEDDFATYACEKGEWTRIPFSWDDEKKVLTIGKRIGSYPGMIEKRVFRIKVCGMDAQTVKYAGNEVQIHGF